MGEKKRLANADDVFGAGESKGVPDAAFEDVEVPEWNMIVRVREMTGTDRDAWEESLVKVEKKGKKETRKASMENIRAKLLVRVVVNEAGERIFSDEQVEKLGRKGGKALDRIFDVAKRLSGIGEDDLEDLQGN